MSTSHNIDSSSNGARAAARALKTSETMSQPLPTFKSQVTERADFEDHIPTVEALLLVDVSLLEGVRGQEVPRTVTAHAVQQIDDVETGRIDATNTTGTQPARAENPLFQTAATNGEGGNYNNRNDVVPSTELSDDNGKAQPVSASRGPCASKNLILVALLLVVIVVVGIIVSLASTSPSASKVPSPTAPPPAQSPSVEGLMCGGGNRRNGDCADDACCSEWGWCGYSEDYCGVAPSPPPAVSPVPLTLILATDFFPEETSVSLVNLNTTETFWTSEVFTAEKTEYTLTQEIDPTRCYRFSIYDSIGDGFCALGPILCDGSFQLLLDSDLIFSGDAFGESASVTVGSC